MIADHNDIFSDSFSLLDTFAAFYSMVPMLVIEWLDSMEKNGRITIIIISMSLMIIVLNNGSILCFYFLFILLLHLGYALWMFGTVVFVLTLLLKDKPTNAHK